MRRLHEIEHVVVEVYVEEVWQGFAVDALSVLSEDAKDDPVNLKNTLLRMAGLGMRQTESAFSFRESQ